MVLNPAPRCGDGPRSNGAAFEAEIYGSISARRDFPQVELTVETDGDAAIEAARRAIERGQPFDAAFVDIGAPPGNWGLDVAETIRALDPELPIALLVAQGDLNPVDLCKRIPPCDRLSLLFKPIQALVIQQLVLAADARRASDRAHALMRAKPRVFVTELLSDLAIGLIVADSDRRIASASRAVFNVFPELTDKLRPGAYLPDDLGGLIGDSAPESLWSVSAEGQSVKEMRLGDGRSILAVQSRIPEGPTACLLIDITDRERAGERADV